MTNEVCKCDCHVHGSMVMHIIACCHLHPHHYLDSNYNVIESQLDDLNKRYPKPAPPPPPEPITGDLHAQA